MCRFVAKNLAAQGVGRTIIVEAVYTRGEEKPIFLRARTGEGKEISKSILDAYDFRPTAVIERLDLRRPIYKATASYGHFGHAEFPWEKVG